MAIARPVTKTVVSTVAFGIPVTDEVNRLTGVVAATAWTAPTLINGWVAFTPADRSPYYRRVGTEVQLRGIVGSGAVGSTIFNLPAGFRPVGDASWAVNANAAVGFVVVDSAGDVKFINGNSGYVYLAPVRFSTVFP